VCNRGRFLKQTWINENGEPFRTCPRCARDCPREQRFCPACGADLRPKEDTFEIGTVLDKRYKLLAKLGEGGMGAVYRVEHVRMGKVMALKLLRPELSRDRQLVERFRREAQLVSKLDHPNVITVFDSGESENGTLYLVMEYIPGRDLAAILRSEGRIEPRRALELMTQVLRGLSAAHRAGIIHRDMKPGNVMIARLGEGGEVLKILDFGIAKLVEGHRDQGGRITGGADLVGTPSCMSPEQARGEKLDPRSDVYSASAMLFELLAGRGPFVGSPLEVVSDHLTKQPPMLRQVAPEVQISQQVEAILQRGLSKDPAHRFQSAEEMRKAIEIAIGRSGSTGLATPIFEIARREDWDAFERSFRRRRLAGRVTALVVCLMILSGAVYNEQRTKDRKEPRRPVTEEVEPNEIPMFANLAAPGRAIRGTIGKRITPGVSDRDMYELFVSTPGTLSISVSAVPNVNLVIELYDLPSASDPRPRVIAAVDDAPTSESEELTDLSLSPGRYFIRLTDKRRLDEPDGPPRENSTDEYVMKLRLDPERPFQEREPNNTRETAMPIGFGRAVLGHAGTPGMKAMVRLGQVPLPTWSVDHYVLAAQPKGSKVCAVLGPLPFASLRLGPKKSANALAQNGRAAIACSKAGADLHFEVHVEDGSTGEATYPLAVFGDGPDELAGVSALVRQLSNTGREKEARAILERISSEVPKSDEAKQQIEALLSAL
jgi:eukaryotic-like serine/threonine-protein kinase